MHRPFSPTKLYVTALNNVLLKQPCSITPAWHNSSHRLFATQTSTAVVNNEVNDVAILGGGITGLACAYYLSQDLPDAKITLLESTSRLGGWLNTETINVGNGEVIFEQGPRSLRPNFPNGQVTLDLVSKLGMEDRLLTTDAKSVASQNRFIYYPNHLVRIPGPGQSFLKSFTTVVSEPVFKGVFSGLIFELFKPKRNSALKDESVRSFFARRFGSALADNLVSAFVHGVYAGDINQLSICSIFPKLWFYEESSQSVTKGLWKWRGSESLLIPKEDITVMERPPKVVNMKGLGPFSFLGGIGELSDTIANKLEKNPNVTIHKQTIVQGLELLKAKSAVQISVTRSGHAAPMIKENFSHVISTIPGVKLDNIADLPPLRQTPAVTVMVVNIFFAGQDLLPAHGFGYLIPRSVPFSENPERALGVVFDSEVTAGQDTVPGTKVTVMLGGHWWNDRSTYPDEDEGARMAKAVLKRHLGIDKEPTLIKVGLQKDCIPQYIVGHRERMAQTSSLLGRFEGRLRVAGSSYTGVGLNDCVRAARDVVQRLVDGTGTSGLESFVGDQGWYVLRRNRPRWH